MTSISKFEQYTGQVIEGQFHLTSIEPCRTRREDRMVLEDYSGKASVLFAKHRSISLAPLKNNTIVTAQIMPRPMSMMMGGTLLSASPILNTQLNNAAAVIPASMVPLKARQALLSLTALIDEITVLPIKTCINSIIAKNYEEFITAKAGWHYHHAFIGGLMVHTVSVMQRVNSVGSTTFIGDRPRIELMILGALIHDLGKSITIQNGSQNPATKHLRHELLNLPLCLEQLTQLGDEWPKGAVHLSRILNWLCSGTEERRRNHCIDAELVHMMDVIDVWNERSSTPMSWGGDTHDKASATRTSTYQKQK